MLGNLAPEANLPCLPQILPHTGGAPVLTVVAASRWQSPRPLAASTHYPTRQARPTRPPRGVRARARRREGVTSTSEPASLARRPRSPGNLPSSTCKPRRVRRDDRGESAQHNGRPAPYRSQELRRLLCCALPRHSTPPTRPPPLPPALAAAGDPASGRCQHAHRPPRVFPPRLKPSPQPPSSVAPRRGSGGRWRT